MIRQKRRVSHRPREQRLNARPGEYRQPKPAVRQKLREQYRRRAHRQIGRQIPHIQRYQRPKRYSQNRKPPNSDSPAISPIAAPPRRNHDGKRQPHRKQSERQRYQMRVQVREQECEERKLRYLKPRRIRRHHPAAAPKVKLARRLTRQRLPKTLAHLYRPVHIPQQRHKRRPRKPRYRRRESRVPPNIPRAPAARYRAIARRFQPQIAHAPANPVAAIPIRRPSPPRAFGHVVHNRVRPPQREREERRHSEVIRNHRIYRRSPNEHRRQKLPPVVIVQVAAREPRVIRRHYARAQYRVQIGEVHRLFPAPERMPQVRISHTNQRERQERRQKQQLSRQQNPPAPPNKIRHFPPISRQRPH